MSSLRAQIRWVVVLLLLCGLTTPGHAATSSAVEATDDACLREPTCSGHYQKALSLYESGRYEAALPEFQSAYESRQMPWLLINIGRTFHRLGRLDEAITLYKRYEQADPSGDPETLKKVREYKAQAEVLLASKSAPPAPPPDVVPAAGAGRQRSLPGAGTAVQKVVVLDRDRGRRRGNRGRRNRDRSGNE